MTALTVIKALTKLLASESGMALLKAYSIPTTSAGIESYIKKQLSQSQTIRSLESLVNELKAKQKLITNLDKSFSMSNISRDLLDYAGIPTRKDITKFVLDKSYKTVDEVKEAGAKIIIKNFEAEVWASYEAYRNRYGRGSEWTDNDGNTHINKQTGGWLGIDDDLKLYIEEKLNHFNEYGSITRYARSLLLWKNDSTYSKWEWSDWYITSDEIQDKGGRNASRTELDDLIGDRLGVKKFEAIKSIWEKQKN